MSIYIQGINLPRTEDDWTLELYIDSNGEVEAHTVTGILSFKAVELPPRGRLIDADRLLEDYGLGVDCAKCKRDERSCQYEMIHSTMDFCGWIDDAKTIIPADGGADG